MKLSNDDWQLMTAFEQKSGVAPRDCINKPDRLILLVNDHDAGQAIGKEGQHVRELSLLLKKPVEVWSYCEDVELFVKKALFRLKFNDVVFDPKRQTITLGMDSENKRKLMNQSGQLKRIKEVALRNYNIKDIYIK